MRWALCCQVQNSKPSKDARTPIFYAFHRNGLLGHRYSPLLLPPSLLYRKKKPRSSRKDSETLSFVPSHFPFFFLDINHQENTHPLGISQSIKSLYQTRKEKNLETFSFSLMGRKMAEEVTKDPIPNDVVMEGKMAEEEVTKDPIPEDVVMDGKMAEEEVTKDPIPEDVVMSILLKLPIKSILRFRCVSKSCNSLITSPYFIKKHFAKAKQLILRAGKPVASVSLHLDNDSLDRCLQLDFCQPNAFKVNGSCNGVVCLSGIHPKLDASGSVILWNPSIRKTLHLPPPRSYARIATTLLGIGYDPRTDDYKVARIVRLGSSAERPFVFQSYSLNSGSWNENVDFFSRSLENEEALRDITLYRHDNQAIVNGAIHWLLYRKGKINIERYINSPLPLPGHNKVFALSFNLSNESFGEIMLPECFDDRRKAVTDRSFSVFKDSLSVNVINCGLYSGRCLCEIWVMNQYDVRESWAIKYQIEMLHIARPVVHRSNGEILIAGYSWSRLVSFDPQTPRIRDTGLELSIDGYADYFVESLALLDKSN